MSLVEESSFEDCIIFVLYWLLCQVKSTSFRLVLTMPVRDVRKHRDLHLERKHVYNVYDQIAPKFSEISQKAWPNVRRFLKDLPPGSVVADIGITESKKCKSHMRKEYILSWRIKLEFQWDNQNIGNKHVIYYSRGFIIIFTMVIWV